MTTRPKSLIRRIVLAMWRTLQRIANVYFHKIVFAPLRLGVRASVSGRHNLPKHGGYFLVSNHQSALDPVFLAMYVVGWRCISFVAKIELWTRGRFHRVLGPLLSLARQVAVDRRNPTQAEASLRRSEQIVADGDISGVFPGATRTLDGIVPVGKTGIVRMAMRTGKPVVLVGALGMDDVQSLKDMSLRHPPKIAYVIDRPIVFPINLSPTKAELDAGLLMIMTRLAVLSQRTYSGKRSIDTA